MLHPLTHHYSSLRQLPTVQNVSQNPVAADGGEGVDLHVNSARDAAFLDPIISDDINGYDVRFLHKGPEIGILPERLRSADEIVAKYGSTIKALPGVLGVIARDIPMGGVLTASTPTVVIETTDKHSRQVVDDIISDQIHYFSVDVNVAPER